MAIDIRPLAADQLGDIMPIMDRAFPKEFGEAWTIDQCRSTLCLPGGALFGAFDDLRLVGFSFCLSVLDNSELLLSAVDPQHRRFGIGTHLLVDLQKQLRAKKCKRLFLEVRENNTAIRFYQAQGFEIIGHRPKYYKMPTGEHLAALTMSKNI